MAWKGLHVSRPAYFHVERGSLVIDFRDDQEPSSFRIPVEDVSWIIADSLQISFSAQLLSRCSAHGVLVLGIDDSHLPNWAVLPWAQFHRHGEVLSAQLEASLPLKKRIWQRLVQGKIGLQADVLEVLHRKEAEALRVLASMVKSGDPDNLEARAAQKYFRVLFDDPSFIRHEDDWVNANLNYGYAVLRGVLARHLSASGFLPQLGVHHRSMSNAFNLADDLIEPFRAFVDLAVAKQVGEKTKASEFTLQDRRLLASLLETNVTCRGEQITLFAAMQQCVLSLKQAFMSDDPNLIIYAKLLP